MHCKDEISPGLSKPARLHLLLIGLASQPPATCNAHPCCSTGSLVPGDNLSDHTRAPKVFPPARFTRRLQAPLTSARSRARCSRCTHTPAQPSSVLQSTPAPCVSEHHHTRARRCTCEGQNPYEFNCAATVSLDSSDTGSVSACCGGGCAGGGGLGTVNCSYASDCSSWSVQGRWRNVSSNQYTRTVMGYVAHPRECTSNGAKSL